MLAHMVLLLFLQLLRLCARVLLLLHPLHQSQPIILWPLRRGMAQARLLFLRHRYRIDIVLY